MQEAHCERGDWNVQLEALGQHLHALVQVAHGAMVAAEAERTQLEVERTNLQSLQLESKEEKDKWATQCDSNLAKWAEEFRKLKCWWRIRARSALPLSRLQLRHHGWQRKQAE